MTNFSVIVQKAESDSEIRQDIINALIIFALLSLFLKKICGLSVSFHKVEISE